MALAAAWTLLPSAGRTVGSEVRCRRREMGSAPRRGRPAPIGRGAEGL